MISVLTTEAMRNVDQRTITGDLTIGYSLMAEAGLGVFEAAREMLSNQRAKIAVFCGKGNNGGDGYVAAKMLMEIGHEVVCYSLCDTEILSGEAGLALREFKTVKGHVVIVSEPEDFEPLNGNDLIIDAMLGTGVKGDPHGLTARVIDAVNCSDVAVLAVDTPSGLNSDTGKPGKPCIMATKTVTMGFPKLGQFFGEGQKSVGALIIKELPYPQECVDLYRENIFYPEKKYMHHILPCRDELGSKFEHGVALLICGSRGMTGAATLSSVSAMRTGCGMVHLAIPESILSTMAIKVTEPVLHPVKETASGTISLHALDMVKNLMEGKNALCIGPGLSHHEDTTAFVRELVKNSGVPTILDADGINAFRGHTDKLRDHSSELIITPHLGEWRRLFGELPSEPGEKIELLREVASDYQITVLLKGNPTLVVDKSSECYILPFGNSALSTAGSGDVLSGVIVSLLAQGASVSNAAILGQYLFGTAGVLASQELTKYSVMAGDLQRYIPGAIKGIIS
ncbi:carbohydrate kinase [Chitinispirillum alkaliphilum]|nr:carbohydrate kinase [Chitinispirillum alkaliphilum]